MFTIHKPQTLDSDQAFLLDESHSTSANALKSDRITDFMYHSAPTGVLISYSHQIKQKTVPKPHRVGEGVAMGLMLSFVVCWCLIAERHKLQSPYFSSKVGRTAVKKTRYHTCLYHICSDNNGTFFQLESWTLVTKATSCPPPPIEMSVFCIV